MESITEFLYWLEGFLWNLPFIGFVMLVGLYFTVRSGFFSVVHFGHIMKNTAGNLGSGSGETSKTKGSVSPFEAVCVAIGGSVGAGNISGVASAIFVGGPGAVFWMWLWAFFGMMVKCVETSLGCYYRTKNEDGSYAGGPMFYMEKGIAKKRGLGFGLTLSAIFCVCFFLQFLQGSQAYSISEIINRAFGVDMMVTTGIYTVLIYIFIWRGLPSIASLASKVVPFMCAIFVLGGIVLIVMNAANLPNVIAMIFHDAFTGSAAFGGFVGSSVAVAMRNGLSRSINSNEAGQGSSPLVHGLANTVHPVRQGLWGAFEVFVDTLVICSITALAVLSTGAWTSGLSGASLTMAAYESVFGRAGQVYMAGMAVLFGLTTTTGWYAYYVVCLEHLLRNSPSMKAACGTIFKLIFPLMNVIIVGYITVVGGSADLFWTIVAIVMMGPIFANLIALLILRDDFWMLLKDYKARYMGIGTVDPNFAVFYDDKK